MLPSIAAMGMLFYEFMQHPQENKFLIYAICSPIVGLVFGGLIVSLTGVDDGKDEPSDADSNETENAEAHAPTLSAGSSVATDDSGWDRPLDSSPVVALAAAAESAAVKDNVIALGNGSDDNEKVNAEKAAALGAQSPVKAEQGKTDAEKTVAQANGLFESFTTVSGMKVEPAIALDAGAKKEEVIAAAAASKSEEVIALGSGSNSDEAIALGAGDVSVNFAPDVAVDMLADLSKVETAQKVVARLEAEVAKAEAVAAKLEVELAKAEPMAARLESAEAEQLKRVEENKKQNTQPARPIQSEPKPVAKPKPKAQPQVTYTSAAKKDSGKPLPDLKSIDEWLNHADKLMKDGYYDEALKCYDKVTSTDVKNYEGWFLKGIAMKSKGRFDDAIYCFSYALGINNASANALFEKGDCLLHLGKADQALVWFDKSLQIDKVAPKPWMGKAHCMASMGKHKDAVYCFDKVLAIEPDNNEAKEAKKVSASKMGARA